MSYNIDRWKVKKLKNLCIPVLSFFTNPRKDWHPEKEYDEEGILTLSFGERAEIKGKVENKILLVSNIEFSGACSGTSMFWILEPALKDSTGELIASCVWEGGDSINRLIVKDGKVTWKDITI
uniref:Uncharacterized protein n=1 Tax=viral metagenome TaxID=1070528 RepID=A0A6H1ZN20_9ZZZZ